MASSWGQVIQMKKIKTKITKPFLNVIIAIPLITLILFNIALRIYFARTRAQELKNTVAAVEVLIRNQIGENILSSRLDKNDSNLVTTLGSLRSVLKASKLATNTEFILFNRNLEVIYPVNLKSGDTLVNERLVSDIKNMLPAVEKDKIFTLRSGPHRYMAVANKLTKTILPRSPYIVFVSPMNSGNPVIRALNLMLILILLFAALICSSIALRVSNGITKPIITLGGYAQRIGKGDFINVPVDKSSEEIYELSYNMNEMSRQLLNSTNAQRTFLQNASHEFRTPLMSIQGYAEGIIKGVFPDTERAAAIICDESKRLNILVEELLTLSHIENKTYTSEMVRINLSHIIREYIQRVNGLALKENKEIITDIRDDNIPVLADDKLLSQAVINVISNCIRYANSRVYVSLYIREGSAIINISDDGSGINEVDLPHIFERFYKGQKGNFGLGLSIAKLAVQYMEGSIKASTTPQGAEFEICLPILQK